MRGVPLELRPFREDDTAPGTTVRASVERSGDRLALRWIVADPAGDVVFAAAPGAGERADRLWEHTCLEAFLSPGESGAYWEVNVSPAGAWNVYRFDAYREAMRREPAIEAPAVCARREERGGFLLDATIALAGVPALSTAALRVGLAVVLQARGGRRSYWALRHGNARPDFHCRDSFTIALAAARGAA